MRSQACYDHVIERIESGVNTRMAVTGVVQQLHATLRMQLRYSFMFSTYRQSMYWFEPCSMLRYGTCWFACSRDMTR